MTVAQALISMFRETETAGYGWIIDTDHLYWDDPSRGSNEAGTMGPRGISDDIAAELRSPRNGRKFRMYDGDSELYYSGRIITRDEPGSEDDFAPLDDFGKPNAGCVEIRYLDESGNWGEL